MLRGGVIGTEWSMSVRGIDSHEAASHWRTTLDYRITPKLAGGIEFNPHTREVQPRATWFISPQRGELPSVVLGASADRLSTPRGHAVFLTFARSDSKSPISPFVSLKYSTDAGQFAVPFGANLRLGKEITLQSIYDGNYTHLLLTKGFGSSSFSLIFARTRHWGFQVSYGF
jgi:hypothetical protein